MTRKKSDKKRRKQKQKKNSPKGKSGRELLKEKVQKDWNIPKEKIVTSQKGVEKMSEVILEFAEPLLDACEDDASSEKAISIAICVWNMSLLSKEKQEKAMKDIYVVFSETNDDEYLETLRQIVDMLIKRKRLKS